MDLINRNVLLKNNFMFFKKFKGNTIHETESKLRYKAVYMSIRSGKTIEFIQNDSVPEHAYFMNDQDGNIYYLSYVERIVTPSL